MTKTKTKENRQAVREAPPRAEEIRSLDEYQKSYFPKTARDNEVAKTDNKDPYRLGVALLEKSIKPFLKK